MAVDNGMNDEHLETAIDGDPKFESRVADILDKKHRRRWRLLWAWIVIFSAAVVLGFHYIQKSRLESCERSYQAFNDVFKPILPPIKQRTAKQQHDIDQIHETVHDFKQGCPRQINAGLLGGKW